MLVGKNAHTVKPPRTVGTSMIKLIIDTSVYSTNSLLNPRETFGTPIKEIQSMILLQLEFAEERYAILKSNSESFKKEASAASEKSRSLQVALSKAQVTLDSVSQVSQCD